MNNPHLLPNPRHQTIGNLLVELTPHALIVIDTPAMLFEAQQAQQGLESAGLFWQIVAGKDYGDKTGLQLTLDRSISQSQAYRLTIDSAIRIAASDSAGLFYGVCTLRQLLEIYGVKIPAMTIEDWPDFPRRGVMLDVSRDKVPTMDTLYALIESLAAWKINEVQLYIEHTFAYQNHAEVWQNATPFTGQEIMELDVFCRQRHIDLVPNQNSLGHMERWLKFDTYLPMAFAPSGYTTNWGAHRPAATVIPADPRCIDFFAALYDEFLPHFTSSMFNVGSDEPFELGLGDSIAAAAITSERPYLDHLLQLHKLVTARGKQMQFWGDIIVHYPDQVAELPKDVIVLEWGYEAIHDFDGHGALFANSGLPFYVCPGTSSWNSLIGRTDNALGNLRSAAVNGLKHGALGYLNTDWGDRGHWQPLPVSYLGFAYGAAVSWAYEANADLDMVTILDRFVFRDRAGIMGQLVYDLGNVYHMTGQEHINGQMLFYCLAWDDEAVPRMVAHFEQWGGKADLSPQTLNHVIERIDSLLEPLAHAEMQRTDAALIQAEFRHAAELIQHGAKRMLHYQGAGDQSPQALLADLNRLIERQRELWLARNRPGGLEDSLSLFNPLKSVYQ